MKNKDGNLKWVFSKTKGSRMALFFLMVITIIAVSAQVLIAYVLKLFIDSATSMTELTLGNVTSLFALVLIMCGFTCIMASMLKKMIEGKIILRMRKNIMEHILGGDYIKVHTYHSADVLTKLTNDVEQIAEYFPKIIMDILGGIFIFLAAIISMYILNTKIALLITVVTPLLIACISLFNFPIASADRQRKKNEEKNRIMLQEQLEHVKTIKVYRIQERCIKMQEKAYRKVYKSNVRFGIWEGVATFCNDLIGNAMLLIALGMGAALVQRGETSVGTLIAIVQLLNYIIMPFSKISAGCSRIVQTNNSIERIQKIEKIELKKNTRKEYSVGTEIKEIRIEQVAFSYEENEVLVDINALFQKDYAYCIIGDNGSGKTTLMNLLVGLYQPKRGKLSYVCDGGEVCDGVPVEKIGFLPVGEQIFSASIKDNVTLFEEEVKEENFERAVRNSGVAAFAEKLPKQYDTILSGNEKEISSGQIQKIGIARTLYRNSPVIILDEPTVNLDMDSVKQLKETIRTIKKDRIVIVITHDEDLISACDYSYHLINGKFRIC